MLITVVMMAKIGRWTHHKEQEMHKAPYYLLAIGHTRTCLLHQKGGDINAEGWSVQDGIHREVTMNVQTVGADRRKADMIMCDRDILEHVEVNILETCIFQPVCLGSEGSKKRR